MASGRPSYQSTGNPTFGGQGGQGSKANQDKLSQVRKEVEDVRVIMVNNLEKTLERDGKLDDMLIKSEELQDSANIFQRTSKALKRKMYCNNLMSGMTLMIVVLVLICLLILIIVLASKPWMK